MFFSNLFKKAAKAPEKPEERRVPDFAKSLEASGEVWMTSQVFSIGKPSKKNRVYCSAQPAMGIKGLWQVMVHGYSLTDKKERQESRDVSYEVGIEGAIKKLTEFETTCRANDDFSPVPGLEGNFRDVAAQFSAHVDDKGNFVTVHKELPFSGDAEFDRGMLNKLYGGKEGRAGEPVIATWDDFYREVIDRTPPVGLEISDVSGLKLRALTAFLGSKVSMLDNLQAGTAETRKTLLSCIEDTNVVPDFFNPFFQADTGRASVEHAYSATAVLGLLRVGAEAYAEQFKDGTFDLQRLDFIKSLGDAVKKISRNGLSLSEKGAEQVANLMTQGPDPYAERPLPLARVLQLQKKPSAGKKSGKKNKKHHSP